MLKSFHPSMKGDQGKGYQQIVINFEPGSVDSTIDNLRDRQLSFANGQFI